MRPKCCGLVVNHHHASVKEKMMIMTVQDESMLVSGRMLLGL